MKKRMLAMLMALALLCCCACTAAPGDGGMATPDPHGSPAPTDASQTTPEPFISEDGLYSLTQQTVYFPEGSHAETAAFTLSYVLPTFLGDSAFASAANSSILLYTEELFERVNEEYLDIAGESEDGASLVVVADVEQSRGYTNVLIREELTFGSEPASRLTTLVLDADGFETGLNAIAGIYDAQPLVAQLVLNRMDQERDKYFSDLSTQQIAELMDLYNGFYVTDTGFCLYFPEGTIAAAVEGPVTLEISETELYPDFVGDVIPADAYVALLPVLNRISQGAAVNFESFDGSPSAYVASVYLTLAINDLPYPPQEPVTQDGDTLVLPEEEMLRLYAQAFEGAFPGLDESVTGIVLSDGMCRVELQAGGTDYHVSLTEAQASEDGITLSGRILYAPAGSPAATDVAGVVVELVEQEGDYRVVSFMVL